MSDIDPKIIEKAAQVEWERLWPTVPWSEMTDDAKETFKETTKAGLEAVADDLRADAWDEGEARTVLAMTCSDYCGTRCCIDPEKSFWAKDCPNFTTPEGNPYRKDNTND